MRNHTTPMVWELSGAQGKSVTIAPSATAPTSIKWQMTNMPTGKQSKFWYYMTAVVVALTMTVSQTTGDGVSQLEEQLLYNLILSLQIYTPILGPLYQHSNTRGLVLGNLIQYAGMGYNDVGQVPGIPTATASYVRTIYLRIPFADERFKKPHEFSPWGGFLEGGFVEILVNPSTALAATSTLAAVTSVTARCWCEFLAAPEACIHVPFNWREHTNIAAGSRITIPDIGSPDGLQGIDQSRGCGVIDLWDLMEPVSPSSTTYGFLGNTTADNIGSFDIQWRDQIRLESPDSYVMALYAMMGNGRRTIWNGAGTPDVTDRHGFPNTDAMTAAGASSPLNSANAMIFPFVGVGRDAESSKLQTIAGAKDINITYVAPVSTAPRLVGHYAYVFDEAFVTTVLIPRIAPGQAAGAELTAKTLNKQTGGTYGVGKLAYVRQKIQGAGT
jgi:hypothetical protein